MNVFVTSYYIYDTLNAKTSQNPRKYFIKRV